MNNRWYDSHTETLNTLDVLKNLDNESRKILSNDIIDIANQIKAMHREEDEPQLSIGIERVIGLFQSSTNARRWYDKQNDLNAAMKVLSTLPKDDFLNIMEGLSLTLQ